MSTISRTLSARFSLKTLLFAALTICGVASPVFGQEIARGKFTLSENVRLGETVLSPGNYTFSVEPIGLLRAISSVQSLPRPVLVFVRQEGASGPVAAVFASASLDSDAAASVGLHLVSGANGLFVSSLCLDKIGVTVDFGAPGLKNSQILAQSPVHSQAAASPTKSGT